MFKSLFIFPILLLLSGCILMKQNETYSHKELCDGIRRKLIYFKISPNITGDNIKEPPAKLRQLYIENNCGEEEDDL